MKEYISNCCGAKLYHPDIAMCKECGEHCGVMEVLDNVPKETWENRLSFNFHKDTHYEIVPTIDNKQIESIVELEDFITTLLEKQREEYVEMIKYNLDKHCIYEVDAETLLQSHDKTS